MKKLSKPRTLLIITQKVDFDDDNLSFFHRWIEKFSEKLDKVYVVCLAQGRYNFPEKVKVYSLGKEKGFSKLKQLFCLEKSLLRHLAEVDGIFVHMCPIYAIASFPLAKLFRKKMILWYLHRSLNWKLRLSSQLVDKIFTASEESCRLKNRKKIQVVGHGIDTEFFKPGHPAPDGFKVLFVGRIAGIKDLETLIEAVDILVNQKNIKDVEAKIIGSPLGDNEKEYSEKLKGLAEKKGLANYIKFLGGKPYREMVKFYQESDVLLNLSPTGGMDKVVLESMACGTPVLVCNKTFKKTLGQYADKLIFQEKNPQDLSQKLLNLRNLDTAEIGSYLRGQVFQSHNLDNLINKIVNAFQK